MDEDSMRRYAEVSLLPLVDADPKIVTDALFAFTFDSVHKELNESIIWRFLDSRNIRRPSWTDHVSLSNAVNRANSRFQKGLERELIRQRLIHRIESKHVLDEIRDTSTNRGVIILGDQGCGKSTVLLDLIQAIQENDDPFLAFRVDRLEPTTLPDVVGRRLGLPSSPVAVKGRPCPIAPVRACYRST